MPTVSGGPAGSATIALFDVDPDLLAARVLACPAVAGLSAGPYGAAVTYLPGRTVPGVRLSPTAVEVHVVARYGPAVAELADQVRAALSGQVGGRQVDIVVEDLADPADPALPVVRASEQQSTAPPPASPPVVVPAQPAEPPAPVRRAGLWRRPQQ